MNESASGLLGECYIFVLPLFASFFFSLPPVRVAQRGDERESGRDRIGQEEKEEGAATLPMAAICVIAAHL